MRFVPDPSQFAWTFGGCAPVARVRPGEILEVFTEDCFGGRVASPADRPSQILSMPFINPQSGPFWIEGSSPGDAVAVHLVDLRPARNWGVSATFPLFGALTGSRYTATLQEPLPERTWIYSVDAAAALVTYRALDGNHVTDLPLEPFHGTVGVAPPGGEVRSSLVPDSHGGNMDTREVRKGVTVYLGVNVPGALLSIGDGHYAMGDGESCGVAVEGAMETTLLVDVIPGGYCSWPRLEDDDFLMVAGSCKPLEDAFRIAHTELVRWVTAESDLSLMDAYQLVSQASRSSIANVCDVNYTVVAKIEKRYLPHRRSVFSAVHARLRQAARAARS